jgi:hypothetical protein
LAIQSPTKRTEQKENIMLHSVNLDSHENGFNQFFDIGSERILKNLDFCGLSFSQFIQYLADLDDSESKLHAIFNHVLNDRNHEANIIARDFYERYKVSNEINFVDYLFQTDVGVMFVTSVIRSVGTYKFTNPVLNAHATDIRELLYAFMVEREEILNQHFAEKCVQIKYELETNHLS